mgnify:CR=1 FL=1
MKNKYTLILIPPDHGPARQLQMTRKGKRLLLSGLCSIGLILGGLFAGTLYLASTVGTLETQLAQMEELKQDNLAKEQEIARLKAESLQVAQDISQIQELELKLMSILSLDPSNSSSLSPISAQSKDTNQSLSRGMFSGSTQTLISDPAQISHELSRLQAYYNLALEYQEQIERIPSILPLKEVTEIASEFGYRRNPFGGYSKEFHSGVDLPCNYGTEVYATASGVVSYAGYDRVYGYKLEIDHGNGIETIYAHNSRLLVKKGTQVKKGDLIAYSGNSGRSTGAHLHYGARVNGEYVDPLKFTDFTKEQ